MCILFSYVSVSSHFYPLAPVARASASDGHDVAVATDTSFAPAVEQVGLRHLPASFACTSPAVIETGRTRHDHT
jgi:UDP:flavonoid glycosyltransferase YjiC (YdhE family)